MSASRTAVLAKVLEVDRGSGTSYDPGGELSRLAADLWASTRWDVAFEVHHPPAEPYRATTSTKPPRRVRTLPGFEWPPVPGTWLPVLVSDRDPTVEIDWDGVHNALQERRGTPLTAPPRPVPRATTTPLRDDPAALAEHRRIAAATLPALIAQVRDGSMTMPELTWYVRERAAWGVLSNEEAELWLQRARAQYGPPDHTG